MKLYDPAIPKELQLPPPRLVVRRDKVGGSVVWPRILILPHLLVGIALLVFAIGEPLLVLMTPARPAEVMRLYTTRGSKGGATYHIEYAYFDAGHRFIASDDVGRSRYQSFRPGSTVSIHTTSLGSWRYACIAGDGKEYLRHRAGLFVMAIFWNGIVSLFLFTAWVQPARDRRLVREGEPVPGKIVAKKVVRGKSTTYSIRYEFRVPGEHEPRTRQMSVTSATFSSAAEGQPITVLYDPLRPRRNVAYELGPYRAER